jgi:hypothetical protein
VSILICCILIFFFFFFFFFFVGYSQARKKARKPCSRRTYIVLYTFFNPKMTAGPQAAIMSPDPIPINLQI